MNKRIYGTGTAEIKGMYPPSITNQWYRAGAAISGATSNSYSLVQADVGSPISVTASYTDAQGTAESVSSSATSAVNALPVYPPLLVQKRSNKLMKGPKLRKKMIQL